MGKTRLLLNVIIILLCKVSISQNLSNEAKALKNKFGFGIGTGISSLQIKKSNWSVGNINYNDSLNDITGKAIPKIDLSLFYQISIKPNIELRPTLSVTFGDGGKLIYQKKLTAEEIKISNIPIIFSCPVLLKFPTTNNKFYVTTGPSFLFLLAQDEKSKKNIPVNTFDIVADFGIGYDIAVKNIYVTPELKYSIGFNNMLKSKSNLYTNTIDKLNRQSITFSLLFRDKR